MELTPLERLLYEVDPLGTAEKYTLTRTQLEDLAVDAGWATETVHAECEKECDCYQRGWEGAVEEAVYAVRSI